MLIGKTDLKVGGNVASNNMQAIRQRLQKRYGEPLVGRWQHEYPGMAVQLS